MNFHEYHLYCALKSFLVERGKLKRERWFGLHRYDDVVWTIQWPLRAFFSPWKSYEALHEKRATFINFWYLFVISQSQFFYNRNHLQIVCNRSLLKIRSKLTTMTETGKHSSTSVIRNFVYKWITWSINFIPSGKILKITEVQIYEH